ncbi:MAG: class I SAM-dependent methyltransferase [Candidatus Oxydemutatoraceae bacterium WSBS_2016_MAG_OTU14]
MTNSKTHFGYREVPSHQKTSLVANVFSSVADRYDVMNDLMSLGIHRLWKRQAVFLLNAKPQHRVLDLAAGTGDLAQRVWQTVGGEVEVVVADINMAMLHVGRDQLLDRANYSPQFVCCDAETLSFPSNSFDRIIMGFGLRNVTDKAKALHSIQRVLKPGGCFVLLEFSHPTAGLQAFYDAWSFNMIPRLGKWIVGDEESYQYLVESIRMHPKQEEIITMMGDAGMERCEYFNLSQGIVAIHRGYKL